MTNLQKIERKIEILKSVQAVLLNIKDKYHCSIFKDEAELVGKILKHLQLKQLQVELGIYNGINQPEQKNEQNDK